MAGKMVSTYCKLRQIIAAKWRIIFQSYAEEKQEVVCHEISPLTKLCTAVNDWEISLRIIDMYVNIIDIPVKVIDIPVKVINIHGKLIDIHVKVIDII